MISSVERLVFSAPRHFSIGLIPGLLKRKKPPFFLLKIDFDSRHDIQGRPDSRWYGNLIFYRYFTHFFPLADYCYGSE
jgi:hypothetical protein